jgi:cytochrome c oxidase subunit 2
MYRWIPFWPRTAAVNADIVNALYIAEVVVCALIVLTVVGLMFRFCLVYRAGSGASRASPIEKTWEWEIGWTVATLLLFLVGFVWGAIVYIWLYDPPAGELQI